MTNDKTVTMSRELAERMLRNGLWPTEADELREVLAAPVVERQEPAAWMFRWDYDHGNGWCRNALRFVESMEHVEHEDKSTWRDITPLYTTPPAPVAVDIDEQQAFANWTHEVVEFGHADITRKVQRRDLMSVDDEKNAWSGWQARACLDKVKELNQ